MDSLLEAAGNQSDSAGNETTDIRNVSPTQPGEDVIGTIYTSRIEMPRGLPGFPSAGNFMLEPLGADAAQLFKFRSLDNEDLAFLVLPVPDHMPVIANDDFAAACVAQDFNPADVVVFLIVTLEQHDNGIRLFANLRAPLLVDAPKKQGAQVVLQSPGYPLRYALQAA